MIITFLSRQHHHLANLSLFFSSFFPYRSITTPPTLQLIPSSPFRPSSLSSIYTTSPTSHFFPVPPPPVAMLAMGTLPPLPSRPTMHSAAEVLEHRKLGDFTDTT